MYNFCHREDGPDLSLYNYISKIYITLFQRSGIMSQSMVSKISQFLVLLFGCITFLISSAISQEWVKAHQENGSMGFYGIDINEYGIGYAVGWGNNRYVQLQTKDYGLHWDELDFTSSMLFDIVIHSNDTIYAAGYSPTNNCAVTYTSTNSGVTWKEHLFNGTLNPSSFGFYRYCVASPKIAYVCGYNSAIFKTTNNGESWFQTNVKGDNYTFRSLAFFNENIGYAACDTAGGFSNINTLLSTKDGGASWDVITSIKNIVVASLASPTENDVYIFGYYNGAEAILHSNDGGKTWTNVWSGSANMTLQGGKFFSGKYGIGVGQNGLVVMTSDGGISWSTIPIDDNAVLTTCAYHPNVLLVAGSNSSIWRRTSNTSGFSSDSMDEDNLPSMILQYTGSMTVHASYLGGYVIITSLHGTLVQKQKIESTEITISLEGYPVGTYIVQLFAENNSHHKQILLLHNK